LLCFETLPISFEQEIGKSGHGGSSSKGGIAGVSHLATVIHKSVQSELFVGIQKNLILIKVLADTASKFGIEIPDRFEGDGDGNNGLAPELSGELDRAIQQVRASQRKVASVFTPLVFQLYPEHVETITLYMADVAMACASREDSLPRDLLNDIQLPNVKAKMLESGKEDNDEFSQESLVMNGDGVGLGPIKYLRSLEHYLFLASIYLSETIEQVEKTFSDEFEVKRLVNLIRPEIDSIQNACSKIHRIYSSALAKHSKWSWHSDFKTV
jgi:hypothetical protein